MLADRRVVEVRPRVDPATARLTRRGGLEILSAGEDGVFGAPDDLPD